MLGRPHASGLLRLIWTEQNISRAEIARRIELSRSAVSQTVNELLAVGLVVEAGAGPSRGGRRPIVLRFQDDAYSVIGVDVGGSHVSVALTDLRGHVLAWAERTHPVRADPDGTRALIVSLVETCLSGWDRPRDRLIGIGIAVPSPLNRVGPDELSAAVLPAWKGRTGFEILEERFGAPVLVDNDANLAALAEHRWGAGRGAKDMAYVKIGYGIGAGHIIDGKLYRGATGVAGELGHLAIDPQGPPCICGMRGCLVMLAGAEALCRRAEALKAEYPDSAVAGSELSLTVVEDAALAGDPLARRIVQEAASHLGIAIAGMLNLLNPAVVIIGGGLARLGDLLFEPIRDSARDYLLLSSARNVKVVPSALGARATALGAATLAIESALSDPGCFPTVNAEGAG